MKNNIVSISCLLYFTGVFFLTPVVLAESKFKVMITPELAQVKVIHNGKPVTIRRNQNPNNRINRKLSLTSRDCPPHCLQPINFKGIETVGELEVLDYLHRMSQGNHSILVIDTRIKKFVDQGTIPGSIHIFGDRLIAERGANPIEIEEIFTARFSIRGEQESWDFSKAKTLVLYCYGIWCGQATRTLDALIKQGYPKQLLKWYRGGIQAWESVGLTTIRAAR